MSRGCPSLDPWPSLSHGGRGVGSLGLLHYTQSLLRARQWGQGCREERVLEAWMWLGSTDAFRWPCSLCMALKGLMALELTGPGPLSPFRPLPLWSPSSGLHILFRFQPTYLSNLRGSFAGAAQAPSGLAHWAFHSCCPLPGAHPGHCPLGVLLFLTPGPPAPPDSQWVPMGNSSPLLSPPHCRGLCAAWEECTAPPASHPCSQTPQAGLLCLSCLGSEVLSFLHGSYVNDSKLTLGLGWRVGGMALRAEQEPLPPSPTCPFQRRSSRLLGMREEQAKIPNGGGAAGTKQNRGNSCGISEGAGGRPSQLRPRLRERQWITEHPSRTRGKCQLWMCAGAV